MTSSTPRYKPPPLYGRDKHFSERALHVQVQFSAVSANSPLADMQHTEVARKSSCQAPTPSRWWLNVPIYPSRDFHGPT